MSHGTYVAYFSAKRLMGEALVGALRTAGLDALALEGPTLIPPARSGQSPTIAILIAPDSREDAINAIRAWRRTQHIHVVVVLPEDSSLEVMPLIEAGASACIGPSASLELLLSSIEAVRLGESPSDRSLTTIVFSRLSAAADLRLSFTAESELTAREQEIFQLLAAGLSNKRISYQLEISISTVKNHVHNILSKLRLSKRREILQWAVPRMQPTTQPKDARRSIAG